MPSFFYHCNGLKAVGTRWLIAEKTGACSFDGGAAGFKVSSFNRRQANKMSTQGKRRQDPFGHVA